jgi:hypothetical protein
MQSKYYLSAPIKINNEIRFWRNLSTTGLWFAVKGPVN